MSFDSLGLSPNVLQAVAEAGYAQPTPIQAQAIPVVLQGRDIIGCAQTGTGKTAGFTLPMVDILASGRARARMPRSLILEPTRELAAQVAENFETYGKGSRLSYALLIGGVSLKDQEVKLMRGVDVLIATPGRLLDHFERGGIMLSDIKVLVVDEADRMLDMGFIPDIERIVKLLPASRQTLMFSATMPPEIRRLAQQFLKDPVSVAVAPPASPAASVTQGLCEVRGADKRDALIELIAAENVKNALIFCNRKRDVDALYRSLKKRGLSVGALHCDMDQATRLDTLEGFKRGDVTLLVCSDVAARGLDIAGLSHVFNFDVPTHAEDYVHRIGRTGRAGMTGRAFTFATPEDWKFLSAIEKLIGKAIPRVAAAKSSEPSEVPVETPRPKESAPSAVEPAGERRRSPRRRDSEPKSTPQAPKPTRQDRLSAAGDDASAPPASGFGDHVPAFLLRPVRPITLDDEPATIAGP